MQLVVNGSPLGLLISASDNYIAKATQAIKDSMIGSPAERTIRTIEYLNANNAILSKTNAQLVATARTRQQVKKGKQTLGKARLLDKEAADAKRAEIEAKEAADIAHRVAMDQKKKEQMLKKAQQEAEKAEKAVQRAIAKDMREINVEMARMARVNPKLFT
ncbi:hypothetical protein EPUS_00323 [Endocarpon pusillum Z07020]|uniref:Uncharacterized protein n=1 Tax=Endocarpon pusillum (strain Z07020 / HMAS-L-300199) TaxID=1263415 RepID=U1GEK7_ENDPU|nr:uncharacterized protein EPUS_00323 [Endocarpon pusillum Z07020]ERF70136.1 hypothetical protein EPUS_00323 [Endocarpon pusillum Z07020]